ncbi:MAG TPA: peptide MFS transporter [Steroidobacteraceae bacterium]|nr:peptide MFS transporter [Steroidobacteraceae bacterium]
MTATFFGHPRGLATLFFTEMWERFTYYGMRAILVLFLVAAVSSGGFGIDDRTATAIYGLYTAAAYLAALPGGWIADRLIGAQRAVLAGGCLIAVGNTLLAIAGSPRAFYLGLVVVVLGVGLLKPNASAVVADLYPEKGARLDAGFTVFYMGINVGGFLGPLVTGWAQVQYGARAGFAAAGFFMAVGVVQFLLTRKHLGSAGLNVASKGEAGAGPAATRDWRYFWLATALAAAVVAAVSCGWIRVNAVSLAQGAAYAILGMAALFFLYYFTAARLDREERRHGVVLVVLFVGCTLFFSGYEQAGSSMNLFAERYTDRVVTWAHFVIPTGWFQSLNSAFIFIFAPFFAWLWVWLAKRNLNPSAPAKFALGVIQMGLGFLVLAAGSTFVAKGAKVGPSWLTWTYLLHTFGELCLSPVGLSYTTKLSPKRFVGQMMGMWFLFMSLGNLVAGLIAGEFDANNVAAMPGQYMHIVYFSVGLGTLLLVLSRPVKKLMGNVQ